MRRVGIIAVLVATALATFPARAQDDCSWSQYGYDPGHSFAQHPACSEITALNVGALAPKWVVSTTSPVTASPSVAGGTVYVGANDGMFYAVDAETGVIRWTFEVTDGNSVGFGRIVSSAAIVDVADRKVILFGGGATLYALDADPAASERVLASVCVDPRDPDDATINRCGGSQGDIEIESSPAVVEVDGVTWVLVGMDVHNDRDVGRTGVIALRLEPPAGDEGGWSLEPVWKFDPENRQTYTGDDLLTTGHGTGDGCGGVWSSPVADVAGDTVIFGTASCSVGSLEEGPLSGESVFGISLRTGGFRWQYNPRADRGESTRLDDDFGASPNLLPNDMVGIGGKDGWYYGLKRDRGDANSIAEGEWATRAGQAGHAGGDFAIGGMIGTAAVGEWFDEPAIFATTAISTPLNNSNDGPDETLLTEPQRMFSIHAISAIDGRILWRSPLSRQSYGAPTYARGLVFVPSTVDLAVNVFHADTGLLLRRLPVYGAPSSAPAIVGDSIYVGSGTSVEPFPLNDQSGIVSYALPT